MWVWVVAGVLGFIAVIFILLAIPVDMVFQMERDQGQRPHARTRLKWMFGLVHKDLRRPKPKVKPKKAAKKSRGMIRPMLAMIRTRGFLTGTMRLMIRLLRRLHIHEFYLHLRLGLEDPADLGRLWAIIGPIDGTSKEPLYGEP